MLRQIRGGVGQQGLQTGDVAGQARLHFARAGTGEKRQREALQVAVQAGPQVVHDALAHPNRDIGLGQVGDGIEQRHPDQTGGQIDQQRQVLRRQGTSTMLRIRKGLITPLIPATAISNTTSTSAARCGASSSRIRAKVT